MFASCFYVLFKFRFVREATQGGTLVKPLKIMCFFIYDANYFMNFFKKKLLHRPPEFFFIFDVNYFINFLKKNLLRKRLKVWTIIYII